MKIVKTTSFGNDMLSRSPNSSNLLTRLATCQLTSSSSDYFYCNVKFYVGYGRDI